MPSKVDQGCGKLCGDEHDGKDVSEGGRMKRRCGSREKEGGREEGERDGKKT